MKYATNCSPRMLRNIHTRYLYKLLHVIFLEFVARHAKTWSYGAVTGVLLRAYAVKDAL